MPNFITQNTVIAKVENDLSDREKLKGAVVCIPNADPGFDWLFSGCQIGGLITAWGRGKLPYGNTIWRTRIASSYRCRR